MFTEIIHVMKTWMQGEINNLIKIWLSIFISLIYCYFLAKILPKGIPRFLTILPVILLFLNLPLYLHSMTLGGFTGFFISWLANFKLAMFAFGVGPLSDPSLPLSHFVALSCFPIEIQRRKKSDQNPKKRRKFPILYTIKALLIVLLMHVYNYSERIHPNVVMFLYCAHGYFTLELTLAVLAVLAKTLIGADLVRQFDEPYLSTSLQDFWGKRWNMIVSRTLKPSVYEPVLMLSLKMLGQVIWAPVLAVFSTFVVSAVMHELIFYYLGRLRPTGEVTLFFLLHGSCLIAEILIKNAVNGRWRVPQVVSMFLTFGFVNCTVCWLFVPVLFRFKIEVRVFEEFTAVCAFLKDFARALTANSFHVKEGVIS